MHIRTFTIIMRHLDSVFGGYGVTACSIRNMVLPVIKYPFMREISLERDIAWIMEYCFE